MSLTEDDLQAIARIVKKAVDEAIEESDQRTAAGFAEVHEKFAEVHEKFAEVHDKFAEVHEKLDTLRQTTERTEDKVNQVKTQQREHAERMDGHGVRLSKIERKLKLQAA